MLYINMHSSERTIYQVDSFLGQYQVDSISNHAFKLTRMHADFHVIIGSTKFVLYVAIIDLLFF
jgi:hypothetical protein